MKSEYTYEQLLPVGELFDLGDDEMLFVVDIDTQVDVFSLRQPKQRNMYFTYYLN